MQADITRFHTLFLHSTQYKHIDINNIFVIFMDYFFIYSILTGITDQSTGYGYTRGSRGESSVIAPAVKGQSTVPTRIQSARRRQRGIPWSQREFNHRAAGKGVIPWSRHKSSDPSGNRRPPASSPRVIKKIRNIELKYAMVPGIIHSVAKFPHPFTRSVKRIAPRGIQRPDLAEARPVRNHRTPRPGTGIDPASGRLPRRPAGAFLTRCRKAVTRLLQLLHSFGLKSVE